MRLRVLAVALLAAIALSEAWADGPRILLRAYEFDPLVSAPAVPVNLRAQAPAAGQQGHYLVQCAGRILPTYTQQMEASGAKVLDYIPEFAFDVRATPEQAAQLGALPFVRWVGLMQPAYKIEPGLLGKPGQIDILACPWQDESPGTVAAAAAMLGARVTETSSLPGGPVRMMAAAPVAAALAGVRSVSWVETWTPKRLYNDVARRIMNVSFPVGARTGGYDVWRNDGLFGAGEIIGIADSGLDSGDEATISPDFAGRIRALYTYSPDGNIWDLGGHGTHVAGSVLGNGVNSGSIPNAHNYTLSYAGVAPEAELVFQRLGRDDSEGGIFPPADLRTLFQQSYNDGARIHTNSWGGGQAGIYDSLAQSTDRFTWEHKDMLILFAAGNEGFDITGRCGTADGKIDPGSVTPPATAKNCLTVGASESVRPEGNIPYGLAWPSDFPRPPVSTDLIANNENGLAAFSSRGPTSDSRTKPDIVAPGTWILSVNSQMLPGSDLYQFMSGTSMATPLTAGSAALVREYYRRIQNRPSPSAALIKATLMNSADEMAPGQYGVWMNANCTSGGVLQEIARRPNSDEGWGRVNVGECTYNKTQGAGVWYREGGSTRGLFSTDRPGMTTGQTYEVWFKVTDRNNPFRATLVWTDYPSFAGASRNLVNDLDLEVAAPTGLGGVTFFGRGDRAVAIGDTARDRNNNAEEVTLRDPLPGDYRVRVTGYNVSQGPQPFALIVSGSFANSLSITGLVTDEADQVMRDVEVRVYGRTGVLASAFTDNTGSYEFDGLSPGTYTVKPVPKVGLFPEFSPTERTVRLPAASTSGDAFGIDFVLTVGRTIQGWIGTAPWLEPGFICDVFPMPFPQGSTPIRDVVVTAVSGTERVTTTSNVNGHFQFGRLTAGTWTVTCARPSWYFHPPTRLVVFADPSCNEWWLWFTGGTPEPRYTIKGFVRTKSGRAVPGVRFNLQAAQHGVIGDVLSDSSGFYSKTPLLWDDYTVTATVPGYLVHPVMPGGGVAMGTNRITRQAFIVNITQDWFAEARGLAVTNLVVGPSPRVRQTSPVTVTVKNWSTALEQNVAVTLYDNQAQVGTAQVIASLPGLAAKDLVFYWVPASAGQHVVRATVSRVEAEAYVGDNTRSVNVVVAP